MSEKLAITILTDKSSWFNTFNKQLLEKLQKMGHSVNIIYDKKDLINGDIAFFLSCFEIIDKSYLKLNRHNIVVHASNLPKGKGWSPITWQILEGLNQITVSLFEATEECDSGDIYIKENLYLDGSELIKEWQNKLGYTIINMCHKYIQQYDTIKGNSQIGEETFYKRRSPKDSELDITKSIAEQFNLLRVVDNEKYPAYFYNNGQKYIITINKANNEK